MNGREDSGMLFSLFGISVNQYERNSINYFFALDSAYVKR